MTGKTKAASRIWRYLSRFVTAILLIGIVTTARESTRHFSSVSASELPRMSLDGYRRLLILAPHCDDETLGSAGLILAAQRAGIQVRVVIATNGDGYLFATMQDFHKLFAHPVDFIRMGNMRQQESLAALNVLGVKPDHVTFLSYPDRGSPAMWNDHWFADNPYRSPYSKDTKSPYQITYNPNSVYAGVDYLSDLESILRNYRPDLIVYPHPDDVHPDHWGLNVFTRLAVTLTEHDDPTYRPAEYTYLVHRPDFPTPKGLRPQDSLLPPVALYDLDPNWVRLDLTAQDIALKDKAVQEYRSQLPLLRGLMESFVRANELFAPVVNAQLATVAQGDPRNPSTWMDPNGQPIPATQLDPVKDFVVRNYVPASDLVAMYVARDSSNILWMCAQARVNATEDLTYTLRLKALTATGIVQYGARSNHPKPGWHATTFSGTYVCDQVKLVDLGNPWAVYVGADSVGPRNFVLDQIAWQMVFLQPVRQP